MSGEKIAPGLAMALKSISREADADGSRRKRKRAGDVCEYVSERLSG